MKNAKRPTIKQVREYYKRRLEELQSKQIPEHEIREVIREVTALRKEVTILRAQSRVLDIIEAAQRGVGNHSLMGLSPDFVSIIQSRLDGRWSEDRETNGGGQ